MNTENYLLQHSLASRVFTALSEHCLNAGEQFNIDYLGSASILAPYTTEVSALNAFWRYKLCQCTFDTGSIRLLLVDNVSDEMWYYVFLRDILPHVIRFIYPPHAPLLSAH